MYTGPTRCDTWIRQGARPAIVTSSFKIFLTQTFPLCGATCYILPSRTMHQPFNGVNFVYHSVEVYGRFRSYLGVLVRIWNFYNGGRTNYTGDLLRYVLDRLFDNSTDKPYWNVDDRNNVDLLWIITRETKSKLQNSYIRWRCNTNGDVNCE